MGYTIAITGKGGTGKTTVAALSILSLVRHGRGPVLAVDADPNACLDALLGVRALKTVGGLREEAREAAGGNTGISGRDLLELRIAESLVEADGFDLIAMGRPEGPGCYCYANNVLKGVLGKISGAYPLTVIDNEAGLENLSRRIVTRADLMVFVGDPSMRGLETIRRLHVLAAEMKIEYGRCAVIVNRVRGNAVPEALTALRNTIRPHYMVELPDDDELAAWAERGESLWTLPSSNRVLRRTDAFMGMVMSGTV